VACFAGVLALGGCQNAGPPIVAKPLKAMEVIGGGEGGGGAM